MGKSGAELQKFTLRLPTELHEALAELAELDKRSLNQEINHALETFVLSRRPVSANLVKEGAREG